MKHNLTIRTDNSIDTPGGDYGPHGLELSYRIDNAVVLKWPGYNVWTGGGEQKYHKAEWIIGVVEGEFFVGDDMRVVIEQIASIEVGSRSKKTLTEAKKIADQHAKFKPYTFVCPVCKTYTMRSADGKSVMIIPCESCGAEATFVPVGKEYEPKEREQ